MNYKYFSQDGQTFTVKENHTMKYFIIAMGMLIAILCSINNINAPGKTIGIILGLIMVLIGVLRLGSKVSLDTEQKIVTNKTGMIFPEKKYNFKDFDGFWVNKQTMGFTLIAQGFMNFVTDRGNKQVALSAYFFTARPFQKMSDELMEIMGVTQN
ncbi:MAG TPA: hypothetical protein VM802_06500 [Chitinophaga sp.]|uniref:hypothetical protein n=1 Tax=Chitinophaga sp. TaxID=1869181 RepID=UPI002B79CEF5|nr:hypothetical protein [Chitinophaga sp.]HVI44498.1 hypothetical protein [Chitinophaga sp.]